MTKRILLFVAMMFCAVSVFAQYIDKQGVKYRLTDGTSPTADVLGHTDDLKTVIDIPATISENGKEYKVTSIDQNAFGYCSSLTSVTIPNTVTSIGVGVFYNCTQLATVTIPKGVTSIGNMAFYGCKSLTSVTIPNSVTSIGESAFGNCTSLTSVIIPNSVTSIGESAFYDCANLTSVTIANGVTSIGENAFGHTALTTVTIPNSVTSIGKGVFANTPLTTVTIPNSVTSIGENAFYNTALTSVTIPNSVTSIGNNAFQFCSSLTSVTIPNSVTSIGENAFYGCTSITDVYCYADPDKLTWNEYNCNDFKSKRGTKCHVQNFDKWYTKFQDVVNVTFVGVLDDANTDDQGITYTFDNDSHTAIVSGHTNALKSEIVIPSAISSNGVTYSVTSIGNSAFEFCSSLTSVTIPNSVPSIGNNAFEGCTSLASVTIPNSVTSIGNYAFRITALTSVTIPNSVTSIGEYAFNGCTSLTSVTIPNSVTSIGKEAFYDCTSVTDVYCYADPDNLTWNENYCNDFQSGRATKCHVQNFDKWYTKFQDVVNVTFVGVLDDANTDDQGIKYTLYDDSYTAIVSGHTNALKSKIVISSAISSNGVTYNVTSIGEDAFFNCTSLTSVTIPNSVTSIGRGAFYECEKLTSVTIPNSVTSIGEYAFSNCKGLISLTIPNSVTSIENSAFRFCSSLTSVTIPNSVTSIGEYAFSQCTALASVTIPNSVTSIGNSAFQFCSSLTSLTIPNSVTSIDIDAFNECTSITDVYCYADPDKLTWNDGDCNDFQYYRATTCHVLNLDKWTTNFQDVVNVTFVDDLVIPLDGNNTDYQGITYTLDDESHTAVVSGHTDALKSEITIPSTISSNGVTYSVTSIGSRAFYNCKSLTSVTIPNSVTSIGDYAFFYCTNLTSVTIPNSVKSIGNNAFESCSLASVTIPNSVKSIGSGAFDGCTSLASVTIPNSVTSIGNYAFRQTALVSVTIPNSVKSIGNSAFQSCSSLTSVTIPNSVTSIDRLAFYNCDKLTSVTIERGDLGSLVLGRGVFYRVASGCNIELIYTGTSYDGFSVAYDITDGAGINIDGNKMVFTGETSEATLTTKEVSGALSITKTDDKYIATIDGAYTGAEAFAIGEDIEVASVTFNRTFTTSATSTIILPFDIAKGNYSGGDFYTLKSVENNIADMTKVTSVTAHTPYLFVPDGETFSITGNVTIKATTATEYATESEDGKWVFKGIYQRKRWGAEDGDNKDYCFAANATGDISVGEFVKIGTYVQVKPFRCYLTRKGSISKSAEQLPETIKIRLIDETASVITPDDPQENTGDITTPVSEIANNNGVKVWSYDGIIYIESAPATAYTIVDMTGRTLKNGVTNSTRETVTLSRTAGIVIVIINGKSFKVQY